MNTAPIRVNYLFLYNTVVNLLKSIFQYTLIVILVRSFLYLLRGTETASQAAPNYTNYDAALYSAATMFVAQQSNKPNTG